MNDEDEYLRSKAHKLFIVECENKRMIIVNMSDKKEVNFQ